MRRLALILLIATPSELMACFCLPGGTLCGALGGTQTAVFVARVLIDSGLGSGTRVARVAIEERLHNVAEGVIDADLDSSPGGSCHYPLKLGERHVILANIKGPGRFAMNVCSGSFPLAGQEHVLAALRAQVRGEPSRLVGTVRLSPSRAPVSGATITLQSPEHRFETTSKASGAYEILELPPGRYALKVAKPGLTADDDFNYRWSGRMVLDPKTNVVGPDRDEPRGTVLIRDRACLFWDLAFRAPPP